MNAASRVVPAADAAPAVVRLRAVARALGDLGERVVFIGGAVAPLLHSLPRLPRPRPTKDVDGVVFTTSYGELGRLQETLRSRGFRESVDETSHANRWVTPTGDVFDLVSAGEHPGATGNPWDQLAIDCASATTFDDGLTVRHASGPGFLTLKWAAHHDRFADDPVMSRDLEDLLGVIASRPELLGECATAPPRMKEYLAVQARAFLDHPEADDLLLAHLGHSENKVRVLRETTERLQSLAQLLASPA